MKTQLSVMPVITVLKVEMNMEHLILHTALMLVVDTVVKQAVYQVVKGLHMRE